MGQISESDVLLAAASNAIIVGFQVRPSASARKLAEKEEIEIRLYSIIYDAINDIKDAIEGMLEPVMKEEIVASVEVLEIFKISKVGTVAGCIVREVKLQRNTPIRVIRDGIEIYTGTLGSLTRVAPQRNRRRCKRPRRKNSAGKRGISNPCAMKPSRNSPAGTSPRRSAPPRS